MANKLVHPVTGEEVSLNDPMPPTEPGHKGASLGGGDVFDPNAALRFKRGEGPGLQDSERMNPAHWPQTVAGDSEAARAVVEREAKRLEAQAKKLRDSFKENEDAAALTVTVGEADLRGETKKSK
jgi:hypothetical protein